MTTKLKKKPKASTQPECPITERLLREGFIKFDNTTFKLGDVFALRPRNGCPWWTVPEAIEQQRSLVRRFPNRGANVRNLSLHRINLTNKPMSLRR